MVEYKLPEETINKILAYLGKQSYEEVAALVVQIQQEAEKVATIEEEEKEEIWQSQK